MTDLEQQRDEAIARNTEQGITHQATKCARAVGHLRKLRSEHAPLADITKAKKAAEAELAKLEQMAPEAEK